MASQEETFVVAYSGTPVSLTWKYSNRVLLKTILERDDRGLGLLNERVVVGGWVKSSKEVKKELVPTPPLADDHDACAASGPKGKEKEKEKYVSWVEILQSRFPFIRTTVKDPGGGDGVADNQVLHKKLESLIPKAPILSTVFLQINDGSCVANVQVVVESTITTLSGLLPTGTCVLVEGVLKQPSRQGKHVVELKAEEFLHIGTIDQDKYPLSKRRLRMDKLRDSPHFRPRTTTVASVMRIRDALTVATHSFFQNHSFLYIDLPIMTSTDSEGFSEKLHITALFNKTDDQEPKTTKDIEGVNLDIVKGAIKEKSNLIEELKRSDSNREALLAALQDIGKTNELASQLESREKLRQASLIKLDNIKFSEDFFSRQTYLTVSGRLHLESYACALGNVYSFGPRFRAEKKESPKHVAEMWMVETEIAFSQLEDAIHCADDYFKFLCKWIVERSSQDLAFVSKRIDKTCIDRLQSMISSAIEKVPYTEAVKILEKVTEKDFETKLEQGVVLTAEHLSFLADEIYKGPVIVYNYPKAAKPFYVRVNDDGNTVAAFDMVVPKVGTLITGSQNEERINILNARISELGLPREQYEWYLDLRQNGTVNHSGFSLGFDLMVLFATGLTDIRDVIPFPRSLGKGNN